MEEKVVGGLWMEISLLVGVVNKVCSVGYLLNDCCTRSEAILLCEYLK